MSDEITESKRKHLESRIKQRDKVNRSILDSIGVSALPPEPLIELEDAKVDLSDKPEPCPTCKGTGKVETLFSRIECYECFGTKYDLSNPVAIIKWQQLCLEWARKEVSNARHELYLATTTAEERLANTMEDFYKNGGRKD